MAKMRSIVMIGVICLIGFNPFCFGAVGGKDRAVLATIHFKNDSTELNPEIENELKNVQTALETDPNLGLQIEGYGDKAGLAESNREISQKRLQAVRQWFIRHGVDPGRLVIKSPGDSRPVAENDAPPADFIVRRVEIVQMKLKLPSAFLPAAKFEFEPVVEGKEVTHEFIIQNKGAAPLQVKNVKTD